MKKRIALFTGVLFLIYIIMFNSVIVKYFLDYLNVVNVVFFGIVSLITYLFVGFPKSRQLFNYNAIQTLTISFIIYYVVINGLGLVFGFVSNVYSMTMLNIIKNMFMAICFYFLREAYRYMMIKEMNGRKNGLLYWFITLLFILLDVIMEINGYDLSTGFGIFSFVCASVIPSIAINLLLSYIAGSFNFKVLLLFILILKLPIYFLPILPNLGDYLNSVILVFLIFNIYYELSVILEKYERRISFKKIKKSNLSMVLLLIPTILLAGVVSGLFKYHLFAIVSDSMLPVFSRGDAVLVEKVKENELATLKAGDILAFYAPDGRIIVHRIMEIERNNGKYIFKTKGDNNASADVWITSNEDVYGRVITHIKYVGIPSVEISEFISG